MTRQNLFFLLATLPLLFLIPVTFIGLSLYTGSKAIEGISVSPESLYGGPLPPHVKVFSSIELREGYLSQYHDTKRGVKVSLVQASKPGPGRQADQKLLLNKLKHYSTGSGLSEDFSPVIIRFASAQFDPRRASEYSVSTVSIGKHQIQSEKFKNNRDVFFEMGVFDLGDQQLLFLASNDDQPVNSEGLYAFLSEVPLLSLMGH